MATTRSKNQAKALTNGHNVDNASLAEVVAPAHDIPPEKPTHQTPHRKPLKEIAVKKPTLTEEVKPSARIYWGPPSDDKFFRVLLVDGLVELRDEVDADGRPLVEFTAYHVLKYEGVDFLIAGGDELLEAIKPYANILKRYHLPCVTEDDVYVLWVMAVSEPQRPQHRRRFAKDAAQEQEQKAILTMMQQNKDAAIAAVHGWIRRQSSTTDRGRTIKAIPPKGPSWQTRQPVDPGFDAETWVYSAYGDNVITDENHDALLALRGELDA
jgi:hypothetical protein